MVKELSVIVSHYFQKYKEQEVLKVDRRVCVIPGLEECHCSHHGGQRDQYLRLVAIEVLINHDTNIDDTSF